MTYHQFGIVIDHSILDLNRKTMKDLIYGVGRVLIWSLLLGAFLVRCNQDKEPSIVKDQVYSYGEVLLSGGRGLGLLKIADTDGLPPNEQTMELHIEEDSTIVIITPKELFKGKVTGVKVEQELKIYDVKLLEGRGAGHTIAFVDVTFKQESTGKSYDVLTIDLKTGYFFKFYEIRPDGTDHFEKDN